MNTLSHKRIWSDTGGNFEDPLTFSTGLTRTGDTITNNLSTGVAGGQTVIGGTGSGDTLSYKGTTGNGTSTVSGHTFLVGNNGGTTAMQIFNSGNVNIGNATNTGARILAIGQDTAVAYMGSNVGATSQFAIYGNQVTPSGTNYTLTTTAGLTVLNNPTAVSIRIAGVNEKIGMTVSQTSFSQQASSSGVVTPFLFTTPASTAQTAGTETIGFDINMGATIQHASNTVITKQRDSIFRPRTHSFATTGGSMTTATTVSIVGPPIQGTNWNSGTPNLLSLWVEAGGSRFDGRILNAQGADVASANDLTLGLDGNTFEITGTTQINAITIANWINGSMITLLFTSNPTVKNNTAGGAGTVPILLSGSADFSATAGDTLTLRLSEIGGTQAWRELSRTVI